MKKIYMVSDLDNTLLNSKKQISKANKEAIERFVQAGHYFGIATGRSFEAAKQFVDSLTLSGPSIFCNGTMLMDQEGNLIHGHHLVKEGLLPFLEAVKQQFPMASIKIFLEHEYVDVSGRAEHIRLKDAHPARPVTIESIKQETWFKALIIENEFPQQVAELSQKYLDDQYNCMFSDTTYFEIMPRGISKGKALVQLAQEYDCISIAIGDYENDMEMIELADFGIAVENALDCVKAKANYIGKHHDDDAIADIIHKILA